MKIRANIEGSVLQSGYTVNFESIWAKTEIAYSKTGKCLFSINTGAKFGFISFNVYI